MHFLICATYLNNLVCYFVQSVWIFFRSFTVLSLLICWNVRPINSDICRLRSSCSLIKFPPASISSSVHSIAGCLSGRRTHINIWICQCISIISIWYRYINTIMSHNSFIVDRNSIVVDRRPRAHRGGVFCRTNLRFIFKNSSTSSKKKKKLKKDIFKRRKKPLISALLKYSPILCILQYSLSTDKVLQINHLGVAQAPLGNFISIFWQRHLSFPQLLTVFWHSTTNANKRFFLKIVHKKQKP